jgi:phosphoketolase
MYDLSRISPQEKDRLLMELLTKYENDNPKPEVSQDHPDQAQDEAMLEPFAKVLDIVISKLEELEERLEKNEKLVVDDLFGGIDKMYKSNMRTKGVDELRGKYGEMFNPHMDALKELAPDEDLYEALHDMLEPLRGQEGFDENEYLTGASKAIADKIAKIKGEKPAEGVAVEVSKVEATPIQVNGDPFLDKVKRMSDEASRRKLK